MPKTPPVKVQITSTAAAVRDGLRKRDRQRYDQWLAELRTQGCQVAGYRMTGNLVDRLCVRHLANNLRVVTAFPTPTRAVVITLGRHDASKPRQDVYTLIYQLAGIDVPTGERTKPACCDTKGNPPEGTEIVDALVDSMTALDKARKRRR